MLKIFLSGSSIFVVSVLVFSVVRQIIVFPAISRLDDGFFVALTFMVFTFEAVAYGFTGAIPDYYVRCVHGGDVNAQLIRRLSKFCLTSLFSLFIFLMFGMGLVVSAMLAFYLYLFALNALKIKIIFNKLHFSENFSYITFRSVPYLLCFYMIQTPTEWMIGRELEVMAGLLLVFEFLYLIRLNLIIRKDMASADMNDANRNQLTGLYILLIPFVASSLLMGFIQRGDLTLIKILDENYYVDYAKMILTVNFFCAPLSMMVASPLLSFMSRYGLALASVEARRLLFLISLLVLLSGLGAALTFDWIIQVLYHSEYEVSKPLVFYFTVTTIAYAVVRTLVVKYANVKLVLGANISVVLTVLAFALLVPIEWVPVIFFGVRFFFLIGPLFLVRSD